MALPYTHTFEAIGTPWSIDTHTPLQPSEQQEIHKAIEAFDHAYSRFRDDSLVTRAYSEAPGSFAFPPSIAELYDIYGRLQECTDGAVNPLVGEALEAAGYDRTYSLQPKSGTAQKPPSFRDTVTRQGNVLTFTQPALLDIGAIGKGYLVDQIAHIVAKQHDEYAVDAGGDMRVHTRQPYTIGLEHPLEPTKVIGTVELQDQSICASSPNRRQWGKGLHHIIDARTGQPAQTDIAATWAIADTAVLADALTTALFFAPAEHLHKHFGEFRYIIMTANGRITHNIHA